MERSHNEGALIHGTIHRPSAIKINVASAFIVESESVNPQSQEDGVFHDTRDIRLPHHKSIVSHVAVDVWFTCLIIPATAKLTVNLR